MFYAFQEVYGLFTYGSEPGLIILESNSLEVLRKIRCTASPGFPAPGKQPQRNSFLHPQGQEGTLLQHPRCERG